MHTYIYIIYIYVHAISMYDFPIVVGTNDCFCAGVEFTYITAYKHNFFVMPIQRNT